MMIFRMLGSWLMTPMAWALFPSPISSAIRVPSRSEANRIPSSWKGKAQALLPSIETVSPQLGPTENLILGVNGEAG